MKLIDNWMKFFQYLLKNYWTKQQIAQQISNIEKLRIQVVQQLPPATQGKDFTIYLVPMQGETNDNYGQYLRINGQWELIGTTAIRLTNYAVLSQGNNFIGNQNISGDLIFNNANGSRIIKGQSTSQNAIITIPSSTSNYTLSLGEYNHVPNSAVTYTLPNPTTNYSNEIILEVSFKNTTLITFSGTYEFNRILTPAINDVILYLIRYSEIKQKWIIYPMV